MSRALPSGNAPRPRGRELDAELVTMLKTRAAAAADPADGFVSALHEDDGTLAVDGLMIFAWGPSAAVLAKNLGMTPTGKRRLVAPVDDPNAPPAAKAPTPAADPCPACGAADAEVCRLLGHVYPVAKQLAAAPDEPTK
jgi:hypothetical protein